MIRPVCFRLLAMLAPVAISTPVRAQTPHDGYVDFWHRDTMTGDWGGLRDELVEQGITFTATYTGEVFANVQGGMKRGAQYEGVR